MMNDTRKTYEGDLLDEHLLLTLAELSRSCEVETKIVITMVEEGIIEPRSGQHPDEWYFAGQSIYRLKRALRLQRDLELNLAGTALAMDLLEEVESLRARIRALERELFD